MGLAIKSQGTVSTSIAPIYTASAGMYGNVIRIVFCNTNSPYVVTLYRNIASVRVRAYTIACDAGDSIVDDGCYILDSGEMLEAISDDATTTYVISGSEFPEPVYSI